MPVAEIIAIGTELLLGEIQDTNTRYLARMLRNSAIDIFRTTMIGDNAERISQSILDSLGRADFIITTGGLGPTVDDPTRLAVAIAANVPLEYQPGLWDQILDRFQRYGRVPSENNRRQAFVPKGSLSLENQVGTAPSFITVIQGKPVISLPGVPREMEWAWENHVLPFLKQRFALHGTIKIRVLRCAGIGESLVDEMVNDLELLTNPTVGLSAHPGQVDIRITAKADSMEKADELIFDIERLIQQRLGNHIFGYDQDQLPETVLNLAANRQVKFSLVDCGSGGELTRQLAAFGFDINLSKVIIEPDQLLAGESILVDWMKSTTTLFGLLASFQPGVTRQKLDTLVITPQGMYPGEFSFGGPPANGIPWSINLALDVLRRKL